MFLRLSVILFMRGDAWQGACVAGGMRGREACGMHPTGMHSCLE